MRPFFLALYRWYAVGVSNKRKRRPTPAAFLLSTVPAPPSVAQAHARAIEPDLIDTPELTDDLRDALLQKLAARVERIDAELGTMVYAVTGHGTTERSMRHDLTQLCSDVRALGCQMETVKKILTDILVRLPERTTTGPS